MNTVHVFLIVCLKKRGRLPIRSFLHVFFFVNTFTMKCSDLLLSYIVLSFIFHALFCHFLNFHRFHSLCTTFSHAYVLFRISFSSNFFFFHDVFLDVSTVVRFYCFVPSHCPSIMVLRIPIARILFVHIHNFASSSWFEELLC